MSIGTLLNGNVKNMIEHEVHYDDICRSQELGQVIFSGDRNFTAALTLCQDVYGNLIEIESIRMKLTEISLEFTQFHSISLKFTQFHSIQLRMSLKFAQIHSTSLKIGST